MRLKKILFQCEFQFHSGKIQKVCLGPAWMNGLILKLWETTSNSMVNSSEPGAVGSVRGADDLGIPPIKKIYSRSKASKNSLHDRKRGAGKLIEDEHDLIHEEAAAQPTKMKLDQGTRESGEAEHVVKRGKNKRNISPGPLTNKGGDIVHDVVMECSKSKSKRKSASPEPETPVEMGSDSNKPKFAVKKRIVALSSDDGAESSVVTEAVLRKPAKVTFKEGKKGGSVEPVSVESLPMVTHNTSAEKGNKIVLPKLSVLPKARSRASSIENTAIVSSSDIQIFLYGLSEDEEHELSTVLILLI